MLWLLHIPVCSVSLQQKGNTGSTSETIRPDPQIMSGEVLLMQPIIFTPH